MRETRNKSMKQTKRDLCTIVPLPSDGVKNVPKALALLAGQALLNRSFIGINSLIPRVFALPENKTPARAKFSKRLVMAACIVASITLLGACTPTVKVATDEPITINLNVNIQHEIRVKVDKELDDVLSEDSGLF